MGSIVLLRGVTWPAFAASMAAGIAVGIAGLLMVDVSSTLLLVSCALFAAAAGFLLDEQASEVADTTPAIGRQMRLRAALLTAPLVAGCAIALAAPIDACGQASRLLLAFTGAPIMAFTVARLRRSSSGLPGALAGMVAMAVLVVPTELGPLSPIQTFPASTGGRAVLGPAYWWVFSDACALALLSLSARQLRVLQGRLGFTARKLFVATQP